MRTVLLIAGKFPRDAVLFAVVVAIALIVSIVMWAFIAMWAFQEMWWSWW
jgi:hypothetical protein